MNVNRRHRAFEQRYRTRRYVSIVYEDFVAFPLKTTYVRRYSYLCIRLCFILPLPYLSASAFDTFVTASASVDALSSHLLSAFHRFRLFFTPFLSILQSLFQPICEFPSFASGSNVASIAIVETWSFFSVRTRVPPSIRTMHLDKTRLYVQGQPVNGVSCEADRQRTKTRESRRIFRLPAGYRTG